MIHQTTPKAFSAPLFAGRICLGPTKSPVMEELRTYFQTEFSKLGINQYGLLGLQPTFFITKAKTKSPDFNLISFSSTLTQPEFKQAVSQIKGFSLTNANKVVFTHNNKRYAVEHHSFGGRLTCKP